MKRLRVLLCHTVGTPPILQVAAFTVGILLQPVRESPVLRLLPVGNALVRADEEYALQEVAGSGSDSHMWVDGPRGPGVPARRAMSTELNPGNM
jgi:hypothetical protein